MAKQVLSDLDFNNTSRQLNLPAPLSPNEPARLVDLNSAIEGLAWKDSCRAATQANLNLASPGASIDGITMVAGDRVLVRAQTAASENGLYIWSGAATAMTRALDGNTANELEQAVTAVEEGTSAGISYRQTSVNFTLGTANVVWTTFGNVAPPASTTTPGVIQIATQSIVDAGSDNTQALTSLTLKNYVNKKLLFVANVGDGSSTQLDFTHGFNTRDLDVCVFRNSGAFDEILCDVEKPDVNTVRLRFATAPSAAQFRIVVTG